MALFTTIKSRGSEHIVILFFFKNTLIELDVITSQLVKGFFLKKNLFF